MAQELTDDEVANELGVSVEDVQRLVARRCITPNEKTKKFDAATVREWRRRLGDGGQGGGRYVKDFLNFASGRTP